MNIACTIVVVVIIYPYSCEKCVSRYINDAFDFKCPKCGIHIRKQQLMEETKEVYEMKRIKDARKEVFTSFDSSLVSMRDSHAIESSLQRERLCMDIHCSLIL